jgi:hypothetical protein
MANVGIETNETPEQKRAFAEWFQRQQADYFWCMAQLEIRERYRGQVVVLHQRRVLGSGADHVEALADARGRVERQGRSLPPVKELQLIPLPEHICIDEKQLSPQAPSTPSSPTNGA